MRRLRAQRWRGRDDAGISLVELLVTVVLMGILSAGVTSAVIAANRVFQHDDDETTGLGDVRTVVERMGRDVREARGVATGATHTQLQVWIDYNSDYKSEDNEIITWRLKPHGDGVHYDVVRVVGTGAGATEVVEARTLIVNFAFCYLATTVVTQTMPDVTTCASPDTSKTQVVVTQMQYDAHAGSGSQPRVVFFQDRLRNFGGIT
ncbi:MAG: prepilin-type N-terminal cleavage/methylation domain-containing protein [Frankiaceae bacterium]